MFRFSIYPENVSAREVGANGTPSLPRRFDFDIAAFIGGAPAKGVQDSV
jgi:hypothetical protein